MNGYFDEFDRLFSLFNNRVANIRVPHYDLYRDKEAGTFGLEIALAGFNKDEIDIEEVGGKLIIEAKPTAEKFKEFLHQGISRKLTKIIFPMEINWELKNVSFWNGILKIEIDTPENKPARKVCISSPVDKPLLEGATK